MKIKINTGVVSALILELAQLPGVRIDFALSRLRTVGL